MKNNTKTPTVSFNPRQAVRQLLAVLSERSRDIIKKRYGLEQGEALTLEAIGQNYGITRERVRQIEEFSLKAIRRADAFAAAAPIFEELRNLMTAHGGVVHERQFLIHLSKNPVEQNLFHFLLVLGDAFSKLREDDTFHHRWTADEKLAEAVHQSLKNLCRRLKADDLLSEKEIIQKLQDSLAEGLAPPPPEQALRWLAICKEVDKNQVGEWGLASSPSIHLRGVRDCAFLVLRRAGQPLHFTEVADTIAKLFNRKNNPATSHNELIRDNRFVLVGRGLYALAEWGYERGVVKEVIERLLAKHGPLTRDEIVKQVLRERLVKPATVVVNLNNPRYFRKNKDGKYLVV